MTTEPMTTEPTTTEPMITTWLQVEPLDTVMVRDGRSFVGGQDSRGISTVPSPSTLGGVVGAAVGARVHRIVGPFTQVKRNSLFPAPADLVRDGHRYCRLTVSERAKDEHWDLDGSHRRLSHALVGMGEPVGGWITSAGLGEWLSGAVASGQPLDEDTQRALRRDGPWRREPRIGLARHGQGPLRGTGMPGMLYTGEHLRPVEDMRFLLGCENPAPVTVANEVVRLGGRGRLARVRGDRYADPYPAAPDTFPDGRLCVYLVTPALVDGVLWCPAGTSARLCALAVNGPHPVATATPGPELRRSRQLVWTVPAGSVYYLQFATEQDAKTWSRKHHGGLIPAVSAATNPIVTAGFGTCLTGSW